MSKDVPVLQLGYGQQGGRNVEKLQQLKKDGYNLTLMGVADPESAALQNFPEDEFPEAEVHDGSGEELIEMYAQEYPDSPPVVFDSTETVVEGVDQHAHHASTFIEKFRGDGVYATEDLPDYIASPAFGTEKPFTTSLPLSDTLVRQFNDRGAEIIENAVESFMPVKNIPTEDMIENDLEPVEADYVRAGSTQAKSVRGDNNRFILRKFGGAWYDKMPHDVTMAIQRTSDVFGENFTQTINSAEFDVLRLNTGFGSYAINEDGEYVPWPEADGKQNLNEGYAEANLDFTTVGSEDLDFDLHFIAGQTGIKPEHVEMVESWVDDEMREAVAQRARENGFSASEEDYSGVYGIPGWNQETRTERLVAENKQGEQFEYIIQTYGPYDAEAGRPSNFIAKRDPSGDLEILYEGWEDGHKLFVKNVLDTYTGKDTPFISNDVLSMETAVLSDVDRNAGRDAVDVLDIETVPERVEEEDWKDFRQFVRSDIRGS